MPNIVEMHSSLLVSYDIPEELVMESEMLEINPDEFKFVVPPI